MGKLLGSRRRVRPPNMKRGQQILFRLMVAAFIGIALLAVTGGLLARQVADVKEDLTQGMDLLPDLTLQLSNGQLSEAQRSLDQMEQHISSARSSAHGPLWKAASFLPVVGSNFEAVSQISVSADDILSRAARPLLGAYDSLDWGALSPVDGQIDVTALTAAEPIITSAASTVRLSHERLNAIDIEGLLPAVGGPLRTVVEELDKVSGPLQMASSAAQLIPPMLGQDEERNYLLLIQNSAETRATGGIPGALALVTATDGQIGLGTQSSASAMGVFSPSLDVDPEQEAIYTTRLGSHMQNVNLTPDFPTAASTAKHMWETRYEGESIDGVVALDPLVLAHLLNATGPVVLDDPSVSALTNGTTLPDTLTSKNIADTLLSDVYREIDDPQTQDLYFAAVASAVFDAFTHGSSDGRSLVEALVASVKENRLYLWSSHDSEQRIIRAAPISGSIDGYGSGGAAFGVFFNDGTGAKMDFYATRRVQLINKCSTGEYGQYTVRVTATNNAPSDASTSLPSYVTGDGVFRVEPGTIRTNYVVYGPSQAFVETAALEGRPIPVSSGKHGSRPVGSVSLELSPGETKNLDVVFSKVVQDSNPDLRVTPTLQSLTDVVVPFARQDCG